MTVNVRFAPSPTGMLHIGGARTALINKLFALAHQGCYHLRIEDTDKARSTDTARDAILDGLEWLGLLPDTQVRYQSDSIQSHREAAQALVKKGAAYCCYETPEELQKKREQAEQRGEKYFYDRSWRDRTTQDVPEGVTPAIRLKAPLIGESVIHDSVQGTVTVAHDQIDDFVIMRSDGSPTYLLSCVVDDIDTGISHIIRGDDHLTNAFRQKQLFEALGGATPDFAHIPLLHGMDGKKLSKRHGAVGAAEYRTLGYLPEALVNYLMQLGWGKAGEGMLSLEEAAKIFDIAELSRAPARFDFAKLDHLNSLYLRELSEQAVLEQVTPFLPPAHRNNLAQSAFARGLAGLLARADTLVQLAQAGEFYFTAPKFPLEDAKAQKALESDTAYQALEKLHDSFAAIDEDSWQKDTLHHRIESAAQELQLGFGKVAQPLRAALTGTMASPDLSEVITALTKTQLLTRIESALQHITQ